MRLRFKSNPNLADEKITLESTTLNYKSILTQFVIYIGIKIEKNI